MIRPPNMRVELAIFVVALALVGGLGFWVSTMRHEGAGRAGSLAVAGSSTDQTPSSPTSSAPPFASHVDAVGCAQTVAVTSNAGDGLLIVNAGSIQLRLVDGQVALPNAPLAPGSWVHIVFRAPGTYEILGTRYSCTNGGRPAPHFRLTVTVP